MEISRQCVSRELAEKLKELGFPQTSLFYWYKSVNLPEYENELDNFFIEYVGEEKPDECPEKYRGCKIIASAYTVAELGEMLPLNIWHKHKDFPKEDDERNFILEIIKNSKSWELNYWWRENGNLLNLCPTMEAETEADARAKMLIHLAENNLINPKEIKQ